MVRANLFIISLAFLSRLAVSQEGVTIRSTEAKFKRAESHADLQVLYQDNLIPDFSPYRSKFKLSVGNLVETIEKLSKGRPPKHLTLILIKNNAVRALPVTTTQPSLTTKRVKFIVEGLTNATRRGLQLPNTIAALNTWDEPRCSGRERGDSPCLVPLFSLIKKWDYQNRRSIQADDVLVPFFSHFYGDLVDFPWDRKEKKALMRAAAQNGMDQNCTRLWLLELAKTNDGSRLLDVGITNNLKKGLKTQLADYVSIPDHSRWRYLLSTDGFTASCRFGKLLQVNSVVLKEDSDWIEFYYRSVKPHVHYVPFTRDNAIRVLLDLEASDDSKLKAISESAREFGFKNLDTFAKALYFSKAMEIYNSLFGGAMEEAVGRLKDSEITSPKNLLAALKSKL